MLLKELSQLLNWLLRSSVPVAAVAPPSPLLSEGPPVASLGRKRFRTIKEKTCLFMSSGVAKALFTWVRTPSSTEGSLTSNPISGFIRFCDKCMSTSTGKRFL